jgi:hypothetical protein
VAYFMLLFRHATAATKQNHETLRTVRVLADIPSGNISNIIQLTPSVPSFRKKITIQKEAWPLCQSTAFLRNLSGNGPKEAAMTEGRAQLGESGQFIA